MTGWQWLVSSYDQYYISSYLAIARRLVLGILAQPQLWFGCILINATVLHFLTDGGPWRCYTVWISQMPFEERINIWPGGTGVTNWRWSAISKLYLCFLARVCKPAGKYPDGSTQFAIFLRQRPSRVATVRCYANQRRWHGKAYVVIGPWCFFIRHIWCRYHRRFLRCIWLGDETNGIKHVFCIEGIWWIRQLHSWFQQRLTQTLGFQISNWW